MGYIGREDGEAVFQGPVSLSSFLGPTAPEVLRLQSGPAWLQDLPIIPGQEYNCPPHQVPYNTAFPDRFLYVALAVLELAL